MLLKSRFLEDGAVSEWQLVITPIFAITSSESSHRNPIVLNAVDGDAWIYSPKAVIPELSRSEYRGSLAVLAAKHKKRAGFRGFRPASKIHDDLLVELGHGELAGTGGARYEDYQVGLR